MRIRLEQQGKIETKRKKLHQGHLTASIQKHYEAQHAYGPSSGRPCSCLLAQVCTAEADFGEGQKPRAWCLQLKAAQYTNLFHISCNQFKCLALHELEHIEKAIVSRGHQALLQAKHFKEVGRQRQNLFRSAITQALDQQSSKALLTQI